MKFYFNCNNTTQARALKECGVKNVILNKKYVDKNLNQYTDLFNDIMIHPATEEPIIYYNWLTEHEGEYTTALMRHDYYIKQKNHIPILNNYMEDLGRLVNQGNVKRGDLIALGTGTTGKIEEDSNLRKLPTIYKYHGLGKGRWVKKNIHGVDSSTWLSGIRGRKTEVFGGSSLQFGTKGKGYQGMIQAACSRHKIYLDKCNLTSQQVLQAEPKHLLKVPLALYYMPLFKSLNIFEENIVG